MTSGITDVLVVATPSGEKYSHAKRWKISCVSESWISDSANAGYSLKYTDYLVELKKTSTPDRDTTRTLILSSACYVGLIDYFINFFRGNDGLLDCQLNCR